MLGDDVLGQLLGGDNPLDDLIGDDGILDAGILNVFINTACTTFLPGGGDQLLQLTAAFCADH